MPAEIHRALAMSLACAVALVAGAGEARSDASPAGTATIVQNIVVSSRDQVERTLVTHDTVFVDEAVRTGARSKAKVALKDGTNLTLGPNSEAMLDDFVYDPDTGAARFDVTKGVARFITGSMKHDAYSIETSTATIGVRGTDFSFIADASETRLLVDTGEVEVRNAAGQSVVVRTGEAVIVPAHGAMSVAAPPKGLVEELASVRDTLEIHFADATGSAGNGNGADRGRGGPTGRGPGHCGCN
jgi:hypothetical protein